MPNPTLYYFDGRGRAEAIRWLLAACGIEFDEVFLKFKSEYEKLKDDKSLLFEQVPMLDIDGMKLCQTGAILRYLARKGDIYGSNATQAALIDMYTESAQDMAMIPLSYLFQPKESQEEFLENGMKTTRRRYLPVFEKALQDSKTSYLAGTEHASMADVLLVMALLGSLDVDKDSLNGFPFLNEWLEDQKKIPWIAKFLKPGSKRKPFPDEVYVNTVKKVLL